MSAFAWQRRMTRHFGEQWIPFAELHIRSAEGRWRAFSVQVDTGAVITVLPRSAADLLGLSQKVGEPVDLAGVNAPTNPYSVHCVCARLGALPELTVRLAVADREDVPSLLGRLDFLDHFRIHLEPSVSETRFFPR